MDTLIAGLAGGSGGGSSQKAEAERLIKFVGCRAARVKGGGWRGRLVLGIEVMIVRVEVKGLCLL